MPKGPKYDDQPTVHFNGEFPRKLWKKGFVPKKPKNLTIREWLVEIVRSIAETGSYSLKS